jgi:hypothetical protein
VIKAFHIDTKQRLRPRSVIRTDLSTPSIFGRKQLSAFRALGVADPQIGPGRESDENILRLAAIPLREYVAELARQVYALNKDREVPASRLRAVFACDSYDGALEIAERLRLPPGLSIYEVQIDGLSSSHDMSWLDGEVGTIRNGMDRFVRYWSGERVDQHEGLVQLGHKALIELVVHGHMIIGGVAGQTLALKPRYRQSP